MFLIPNQMHDAFYTRLDQKVIVTFEEATIN